jgi:2-phospho-L-lactate guanylyltransferase
MFARTVKIARQISQVVVVSRSQAVRQLAKQLGAWALVESGDNLNDALRQGLAWVTVKRAESVLILPTDLPLLTTTDIISMKTLGHTAPAVVIAACHRNQGTNGLFLAPPTIIDVAFGEDSLDRHTHAAWRAGVQPMRYNAPTIAMDLDTAEDLSTFKQEQLNYLFTE